MHEKSGRRCGVQMPPRRMGQFRISSAYRTPALERPAIIEQGCNALVRCSAGVAGGTADCPAGLPTRMWPPGASHDLRHGARHPVHRDRSACRSCMAQHTPSRARCEHPQLSIGKLRGVKVTTNCASRAVIAHQKSRADARLCSLPISPLRGRLRHASRGSFGLPAYCCCSWASAIWYLTASRSWPWTRSL